MKPLKPKPSARRVTSVPAAKKTLISPARPMTVAQRRAATAPIPNAKPRLTTNEKKIAAELSPKGMKKSAKNQSDALDKKYPGLYKKKK